MQSDTTASKKVADPNLQKVSPETSLKRAFSKMGAGTPRASAICCSTIGKFAKKMTSQPAKETPQPCSWVVHQALLICASASSVTKRSCRAWVLQCMVLQCWTQVVTCLLQQHLSFFLLFCHDKKTKRCSVRSAWASLQERRKRVEPKFTSGPNTPAFTI